MGVNGKLSASVETRRPSNGLMGGRRCRGGRGKTRGVFLFCLSSLSLGFWSWVREMGQIARVEIKRRPVGLMDQKSY